MLKSLREGFALKTVPCYYVKSSLMHVNASLNTESLQSHRLHNMFVEMLDNNVVIWTSKIMEYARKGLSEKALYSFIHMFKIGVEPNATTYSATIGICGQSFRPTFGMSLHCSVLKKGLSNQLFVSTGLVTMYCRNDSITEARQVFDDMFVRDAVSWNSMISGYTQKGLNREACGLFCDMIKDCTDWKLFVNSFTLASILKACAGLGCSRLGESLHGYAIKFCFDSDSFVAGSTIDMYSKCGNLNMAGRVFDGMGARDLVVWNTMITGYAQNGYAEETIELFYQLQYEGFVPNETTYTCVLIALSVMPDSATGRSFHAKTVKSGFLSDVFLWTSVVDMYSKFFDMQDAKRAFDEMIKRNLVSYNALITGYGLIGGHEEALKAYLGLLADGMKPDSFTFISLFTSCSVSSAVVEGVQVHSHSIMFGLDCDASVGNSIVNFYSKCGLVNCALTAFQSIHGPNTISWGGIISGFAQNGYGEEALKQFCKLHELSGKTDEFTSSSVLKAIASWAAAEQGRHLHAHVIKSGLEGTIFVGSALIDMYSKCGMADDSHTVFANMPEKNVVSWNSMIMGYAQNGFSKEALLLFQKMTNSGILPTCVTFIGILYACSQAGLVEEGRNYYNLMVNNYKIPPSVEHCTCMVDLLGRAGYLDDAETFILNSRFSEEPSIWRSLLAACGVHKDSDLGSRAAQYCLRLEPCDSSTYTILSSMYASKQSWCEAKRTRDIMKEMGIEKEPGCSWVEARNKENVFVAKER